VSVRIGINGLGRIGRAFFRLAWNDEGVEIASVNDLADTRTLAHLLRHDSLSRVWPTPVEAREGFLVVGGRPIPCTSSRSPIEIPWRDAGVQVVMEATGSFRGGRSAEGHLLSGAERVIVSAPAPAADLTVVMGVNHESYDPHRHRLLSNASCTTNCMAPILMLLDRQLGIESGAMTTIHCYTNDQRLTDAPHRDLRRARAAGLSMIPTSTSASETIPAVLPDLAGKITCLAVRVPTPNVSVVDFTITLRRGTTPEEVRDLFRSASRGPLSGILGYSEEELVSIDFLGDAHSAVVDGPLLALPAPRLLKVFAWYDNESGYTHRLLDLVRHLMRRGSQSP